MMLVKLYLMVLVWFHYTHYVMSAGLALGDSHSCGFLTSFEMKCWGWNLYGQLGDGTTTDQLTAVSVASVSGVTAISAGERHTCAMLSDGTVLCWGDNGAGQLGDGTTAETSTAVSVVSVTGVMAISAGSAHTCALLTTGTVKCWGSNDHGKLGDGTTTQQLMAVLVSSVSGVTAISAGEGHTCVLLSNSTVQCWGLNDVGQLGDGSMTSQSAPVSVMSVSGVTAISAGYYHTCALSSGGTVQCWGLNDNGQLGDDTMISQSTAVPVASVSGVTAISAGGAHTCALLSNNTVQCWGRNEYGQLGDNTTTDRLMAVTVLSVSDVMVIKAGRYHTCAMLTTGTAQCWGRNEYGQLGDNTTTLRWTAVSVHNFDPSPTSQPSRQPSSQPSREPSRQPTTQPSTQPSCHPTVQPSSQPSRQPTTHPTAQPSRQPTTHPTAQPSHQPTVQPSSQPSRRPTSQPSVQPTVKPSSQPSGNPSSQPSRQPSSKPSSQPSREPTMQPTLQPSVQPTTLPTRQPSSQPSVCPSVQPSCQPSSQPSVCPSVQPSCQPSSQPSVRPSVQPSCQPSSQPSVCPSVQPSCQPSSQPSVCPSSQPSCQPSSQPSVHPSVQPSCQPSSQPSVHPSVQPSCQPSSQPSVCPSVQPSCQPSSQPSVCPSVQPSCQPSSQPSVSPSLQPSCQPSSQPSVRPSLQPSCQPFAQPTAQPSCEPSSQPSRQPSVFPSEQPSVQPSSLPSSYPSLQPSCQPSSSPSAQPSSDPTMQPTRQPTSQPTSLPTHCPSSQPTGQPSTQPTHCPSVQPTMQPLLQPSGQPSVRPSVQPSTQPSKQPTSQPSCEPSSQPSSLPSSLPTGQPSSQPATHPTTEPSCQPASRPSSTPTSQPSAAPSNQPSSIPSHPPSSQPTSQPSQLPSSQPSSRPSSMPSAQPTSQPSMRPTALPTTPPTGLPSLTPSSQPTCRPSQQPSSQPSSPPSNQPTAQPTRQPSSAPTLHLVAVTAQPTVSSVPSMAPTARPSISPGLAVNTATQGALQSLLANGTASSGTVTSVTADGLKLALAVVRPSNGTHNGTTASYAVALPDSSTTVALALPSSLSGGVVAVVVTTVEVDGSRLSSFESSSGNGSSNSSATVALPSPQLVSSVVTIQVSQLSSNGSLTATTVPYFETSVSVTRANSTSTAKPTVLAHNCTVGVVETVSVYCADTAVRLNLTCSGRAAATVRRQCPVSQAVCTVVDLTDNRIVSSTFCRTVDLGSSVVCQCGGSGSGVNGNEIASAGRVSVGVFQVYGAGSLTSSVALASTLSASDVASRSAMIFASFGCLWGVGLLLLGVSWWRWAGERHQSEARPSAHPEVVSSLWLRQILPGFYQVSGTTSESSWWTSWVRRRWVQVLVASHPYLRVLRTLGRWWRGDGSARTATPVGGSARTGTLVGGSDRTAILADEGRTAMLDVVYALTALTMACFALALLYDFQYPEDDGFCAAQLTQATCESRKMLLDPFESQCLWRPSPGSEGSSGSPAIDTAAAVVRQIAGGRVVDTVPITSMAVDETPSCQFNGSNSSTLAFIVSYVITALFAGVLGLILDRCQDVLKAKKTSTTLQDRQRVGRVADDAADGAAVKADRHEQAAVREQLFVREYPEAAVHRQRYRPMPLHGQSRRRHAVLDVTMVDGDPRVTRQADRRWTEPMGRDAEAASTEGCHQTAVSATAQAVTQAKRSMSSTDYVVTMLRLAVADEVGRLGGPAERHVCLLGLYRAFPAVVSLRRVWLWQCAVVGLLVVCNGGALYYIVSKAAVRGYGWQVSFLKIALFEWFSEVVLLRSVEIALFDYGLCWLVGDKVEAAVGQLEAVAAEVTAGSSMVAEDGGVAVEEDAASVSQEMARQWSGLPESRWVAGLRAGRSVSHGTVAAAESRIGGSDGRSDRRRRWWTRLLSRGSLETWEMAVSFGSPLVLAWLVFMYYRFVDGWLTSLSALGQGLAAMTVALSVVIGGVALSRWRRRRYRSVEVTGVPIEKPLQVSVDGTEIAADGPTAEDDQSLVWSLSLSQSLMDESTTGSWQFSDNSSRTLGDHDNGALDTEDDSASEESKKSEYFFAIDMDSDQDNSLDRDGCGGSRDWKTHDEDTHNGIDGTGGVGSDGFSDDMGHDHDPQP